MIWSRSLAALTALAVASAPALAKDNKDDVQRDIKSKGGEVSFVIHFDHVQYVVAAAAIATGNGGSYLNSVAEKIALKVGAKVGLDILARLAKGETVNFGDYEVQGGVATYNHTHRITWHVPVIEWHGIHSEVVMEERSREDALPNTHELYIRIVTKPKPEVIVNPPQRVNPQPDESVDNNTPRVSREGKYKLDMQLDGNLVLVQREGTKAVWASGTKSDGPCVLRIQGDGNMVLIQIKESKVLWASNTCGNGPCVLHVQDDGNLVLTRINGNKVVWDIGGVKQ